MRHIRRRPPIPINGFTDPESLDGLDLGLRGYIMEQRLPTQPAGVIRMWAYAAVITDGRPLAEPPLKMKNRVSVIEGKTRQRRPSSKPRQSIPQPQRAGQTEPAKLGRSSIPATPIEPVRLRPIGQVRPVTMQPAAGQPEAVEPEAVEAAPHESPPRHILRPVRGGQAYRLSSPPQRGLVRPELAEALETVFERFAHRRGFTPEKPLEIHLARGFKAGSPGHGEGRAADILAVGGQKLLAWKQAWDQAMIAAEKLPDPQRTKAIAAEQQRNLGYGLYKALQTHGGWRVNPGGWRPYRSVEQLFGPWTASEGPWQTMQIKTPNPYQQRRLRDQQWVFQAHQDHIHVAR